MPGRTIAPRCPATSSIRVRARHTPLRPASFRPEPLRRLGGGGGGGGGGEAWRSSPFLRLLRARPSRASSATPTSLSEGPCRSTGAGRILRRSCGRISRRSSGVANRPSALSAGRSPPRPCLDGAGRILSALLPELRRNPVRPSRSEPARIVLALALSRRPGRAGPGPRRLAARRSSDSPAAVRLVVAPLIEVVVDVKARRDCHLEPSRSPPHRRRARTLFPRGAQRRTKIIFLDAVSGCSSSPAQGSSPPRHFGWHRIPPGPCLLSSRRPARTDYGINGLLGGSTGPGRGRARARSAFRQAVHSSRMIRYTTEDP